MINYCCYVCHFQNMNICIWSADVLVYKETGKFTSDVASEECQMQSIAVSIAEAYMSEHRWYL